MSSPSLTNNRAAGNRRRGTINTIACIAVFGLCVPAAIYWFFFTDRSLVQASALVSAAGLVIGAGLLLIQAAHIPISSMGRMRRSRK